MNLTTIGNIPSSSNWKHLKGRYVAAAAGVALAVSAVVGLGATGSTSKPETPVRQAIIPASAISIESIEDYAVRERAVIQTLSAQPAVSASEADIAASVLSTEMAHYGAPVEAVRTVSETDVLASARSGDAATYNFAEPAQTMVAPYVLEAAIAASVLSTELAAWAQ